jgi:hypothetical protein
MIWTPKDFQDIAWNFPSVFVPLVNKDEEDDTDKKSI